ncbi:MAG: ABC transporter permease [Lachnospiraceae bacterium]|nr:ABC transporter permease [Lachnospiraceae bacterium]
MIEYFLKRPEKILNPLLEHMELVLITLLFSVALAAALTLLSLYVRKAGCVLNQLFAVLYGIPSLALFALLIPVTGLGTKTAVIVLVVYNQYLLLRNFLTGIGEVDPAVCEAAAGIGMTKMQVLLRVQLPLARKAIFAGIRLAVVSTIGIGTIASSINAGGLGDLLFDGLRTMNLVKILWGSFLSAGLAIVTNAVLKCVENAIDRKVQGQ